MVVFAQNLRGHVGVGRVGTGRVGTAADSSALRGLRRLLLHGLRGLWLCRLCGLLLRGLLVLQPLHALFLDGFLQGLQGLAIHRACRRRPTDDWNADTALSVIDP
ncbi:hypothetical protein GCM10025858_13850 [Alicyclobacillus sacchari]|nr:hypothetical protein GCM10025858_13850 [Alicyclobacillus sacchari]